LLVLIAREDGGVQIGLGELEAELAPTPFAASREPAGAILTFRLYLDGRQRNRRIIESQLVEYGLELGMSGTWRKAGRANKDAQQEKNRDFFRVRSLSA
jgi:hypothetical protein